MGHGTDMEGSTAGMLDGWIGTEVGDLSEDAAIEIIKNWMSISLQRSDGISELHRKTGIQKKRLVRLFSLRCKDTPRLGELSKISAATDYPTHDLVVQAITYLCPAGPETAAPLRAIELPLTSRGDLKLWLRSVRRGHPSGRLTQMELAERIGRSHLSIVAWENPKIPRIPKYRDICAIAETCGVEPPGIAFDVRQDRSISTTFPVPDRGRSQQRQLYLRESPGHDAGRTGCHDRRRHRVSSAELRGSLGSYWQGCRKRDLPLTERGRR
jgi:transcriptional regulator with XRE-family HTH domain/DNA-binding phage protein